MQCSYVSDKVKQKLCKAGVALTYGSISPSSIRGLSLQLAKVCVADADRTPRHAACSRLCSLWCDPHHYTTVSQSCLRHVVRVLFVAHTGPATEPID